MSGPSRCGAFPSSRSDRLSRSASPWLLESKLKLALGCDDQLVRPIHLTGSSRVQRAGQTGCLSIMCVMTHVWLQRFDVRLGTCIELPVKVEGRRIFFFRHGTVAVFRGGVSDGEGEGEQCWEA